MAVIAMRVKSAQNHPQADSLRVYEVGRTDDENIQVIANMDNVYQEGDILALAMLNTVLKDGTKIKKTKLRGIQSFGMALGKVDAEIGTDLSGDYCAEETSEPGSAKRFIKWTSIELLHHIRKHIKAQKEFFESENRDYPTKFSYRAKVKLDGTNGGVQITPDGTVVAQSRSRILSEKDDNVGFCKWVNENKDYFTKLKRSDDVIVLYGEWCGRGIQKRTAISKIDRKVFVIFAIQIGDHSETTARLEVHPARIKAIVPHHEDVFILPFYGDLIDVDFGDKTELSKAVDIINQTVEEIEKTDPWVADIFGVDGLGEGIVLYPNVSEDHAIDRDSFTELVFKAKGEKHQVVAQKKPAQIDPEIVKNVTEFVNLVVTETRLEQGVREACTGEFEMKKLGSFLKWFGQDVQKETQVELDESGLEWKQVAKPINKKAREWFIKKVQEI